jgi:hypothetical protein
VFAWAPIANAAAAPAALVHYYVVDDWGSGYYLNDPGEGNVERTTTHAATFTFDTAGQAQYNGHVTFKMRVNGGSDCLQSSSNNYIYDEACNTNGSNQQFYHVNNFFYSVGLSRLDGTPICIEGNGIANNAVVVGSLPIVAQVTQWSFWQ